MKILKITEDQFKLIEADYPDNFNIDLFSKLPSFAKRKKYADENLQKIAAGSARIVYAVDNNTVLKMAKNSKGIAQNLAEIGTNNFSTEITAEVFEYDEDGLWLEMERARKINKSEFKKLTGINFENFAQLIMYRGIQREGKNPSSYGIIKPKNADEIYENEWYGIVEAAMVNHDLIPQDMAAISSYGAVRREGSDDVVLVDFGANQEVYKSFYKR